MASIEPLRVSPESEEDADNMHVEGEGADTGAVNNPSQIKSLSREHLKDVLATISDLKERVQDLLKRDEHALASIPKLLQQRASDVRKLSILLVGPRGAGKSTLANTLLLEYFSKVRFGISPTHVTDNLMVESKRVKAGDEEWELKVWDCPGFTGSNDLDETILGEIKSRVGRPDLVIICFDIAAYGGRRLEGIHDYHIKKLNEVNDGALFNHCAIAMTQVNKLAQQYEQHNEAFVAEAAAEAAAAAAAAGGAGAAAGAPDRGTNYEKTLPGQRPAWHGKLEKDVNDWRDTWKTILSEAGLPKNTVNTIPVCMFGEMRFHHESNAPIDITSIGPWGKHWLRENWTIMVNVCADELIQLFFAVCYKFRVDEAIDPELRLNAPDGAELKFESQDRARMGFLAALCTLGVGATVGAALIPFTFGLSALTIAGVIAAATGTAGSGAGIFHVLQRQQSRQKKAQDLAEVKNRKEMAANMFVQKPAKEVLDTLESLESHMAASITS